MEPVAVLSAPLSTDLAPLTSHLWAQKIPHRVIERDDAQHLFIADPAHAPRVVALIEQWQQGTLRAPERTSESTTESAAQSGMGPARWRQQPLTVALILLVLGVFAWQHLSAAWFPWMEYFASAWPEQRHSLATYADMSLWGIWRPTLLHFSLLHLLSNALWIWVFAGAMERRQERLPILLLLLVCGLSGNLLQWWLGGPAFGGISGVVYGLAGWTGLRQTRYRIPYGVPPAILGVMVFLMCLTMLGDTLIPGLSGMAHGGHLGGLLAGLLLAVVWPKHSRTL